MPPDGLAAALSMLPLRTGVYVPDDLLDEWFAGGAGRRPVAAEALAAAAEFGQRFECEFEHYPKRKEGVFWKFVSAI
jgi:hypothetical protein